MPSDPNQNQNENEKDKCGRILVVEDDKAIRESMLMALDFMGYKTIAASNGQEALDLLGTIEHPCLILLDLMMPVMNGWQFSEALNASETLSAIPVVVVSACDEKAENLKVQAILRKPVDLDQLFSFAQRYCQ